MPAFICTACGMQYPPSAAAPDACPVCIDERQFVPASGQSWTTLEGLRKAHSNKFRRLAAGLTTIETTPAFAIGQRALLVRTPGGNVLWDCISLLDEPARQQIQDAGGIDAICMSHPHFYGANVDLADAFNARIMIPRADQQWIQRPSPRIELFDEEAEPVRGTTQARIGGHFDGAAVLHWPAGSDGRGALLTGDTIAVVQDRGWVSFMWSYPNLIPLDEATVRSIALRVGQFQFDRIYGGWWGRVVVKDGPDAIRRSADRYI